LIIKIVPEKYDPLKFHVFNVGEIAYFTVRQGRNVPGGKYIQTEIYIILKSGKDFTIFGDHYSQISEALTLFHGQQLMDQS